MKDDATRYTKSAVYIARGFYFAIGLVGLHAGVVCLYFEYPNYLLLAIASIIAGVASLLFGWFSKPNQVADKARDSFEE